MKKPSAPSPDELLRRIGLRRTPVRVGVLAILAAAEHPMDVPTIVGKLGDQTEAVTVYRTLNTFTRKKLIHRVRGMSDPGDTRWASRRIKRRIAIRTLFATSAAKWTAWAMRSFRRAWFGR